MHYVDIHAHRKKVAALSSRLVPAAVDHHTYSIEVKTGIVLSMTVYRSPHPQRFHERQPTLFYVPGTAFIANEMAITHAICSQLAHISGYQVILLRPPLAPEHAYFNIINHLHRLLYFLIIKRAHDFHIDVNALFLAGYSSGGHLVAAITSMLSSYRHQRLPILKQFLISPVTDLSRRPNPYHADEEKDNAINEAFVEFFLSMLSPSPQSSADMRLRPLWQRNLDAVPATDLMVGEYDRFRGDSELYVNALIRHHIPVSAWRIKHANHGFWWRRPDLIERIALQMKWTCHDGYSISRLFIKHPHDVPAMRSDKKHERAQPMKKTATSIPSLKTLFFSKDHQRKTQLKTLDNSLTTSNMQCIQ